MFLGPASPRLPWTEATAEVPGMLHWGQRKLLMAEVAFLSRWARGEAPCTVVYAGAAPGTHVPFLRWLFPPACVSRWVLVDPRPVEVVCDEATEVRCEPMTVALARELAARFGDCVLLMSDVRSDAHDDAAIAADMQAQAQWHEALGARASLLKFRLPWTQGQTAYLDGELMLPVWGPHNTTECRLVVERGAVMRDWDHCEHWERMCHDNRVVRGRHTFECTFFESDTASHSAGQFTAERLDCCADCQRESAIWKAYMGGELDGADTANYLSALASRALWNGASQCPYRTFGCQTTFTTQAEVAQHRALCSWGPAECPLGCDELLRRHEVVAHVRACPMNHGALEDESWPLAPQAPCAACSTVHGPRECPEELLPCSVPGCGPYARKLARVHGAAEMRRHMELIGASAGPMDAGLQQVARALLLDALAWFPEDLCCVCKAAEGDTVECAVCHRFLHEDCDERNMQRRVCAECHEMRRTLLHVPPPARENMAHLEAEVDGDDDDGDDQEEEEEEEDDFDEPDLSGFVVDDDHISFSSDVSQKSRRRVIKVAAASPSPRAKGSKSAPRAALGKRKSAFVIDSPDSPAPVKRGTRSAPQEIDLVAGKSSSSDSSSIELELED